MCTVTYIPAANGRSFILTSNRDELYFRPTKAPEVYKENGTEICFPKDELAGGSWIAATERGRTCCLLNGAYEPHKIMPHHTESRGNVLIEASSYNGDVGDYFKDKKLADVQPFTLLVLDSDNGELRIFNEFIWDGKDLDQRLIEKDEPAIWSSVTLYDPEIRELRHSWFKAFLESCKNSIETKDILSFHSGRHTNDNTFNLVMERNNGLKTVSITQVLSKKGNLIMKYSDLLNNKEKELEV